MTRRVYDAQAVEADITRQAFVEAGLRSEIDRLRTELASCRATIAKADDDLYAAERTISRVRGVCTDDGPYAAYTYYAMAISNVGRVLDGGPE